MDEHPLDSMILEKARNKGNSRADDISKQSGKDSPASARKTLKRKRSADALALNISRNDIVESVDRDSGGSTSDSQDSNVAAQDYKSPVGVTVIGDDEDEVQLGMQKAMRLPRYFTQRSFGGSSKKCFNCGQQGHFNRDCPNARKEKPCFLCAKYGHSDMRCPASKVRCYRCNRLGHLNRDCPYPQNSLAIPMVCTKCGNPDCSASGQPDWVRAEGGCTMSYSTGDLDVIRCYVCNRKGHLICKKTTATAAFPYCFNCGGAGHLGTECSENPTYLASMEKREASNQRGLDGLRGNDSSADQREPKRARRDSSSSSYWQNNPANERPAVGLPYHAPELNFDPERFRYPSLPPIQQYKPQMPQQSYQTPLVPGQQYGQAHYQQLPNSNYGQSPALGGFTMGYVPQPQANHQYGQRLYPRNGRRR